MARQPLAPVVAVLNMKGGVGKTTITANVFRELFRSRQLDMLLVDFDAQFNLSQLLLTRTEYEAFETAKRTIHAVLQPADPDSVFAVATNELDLLPDTIDVTTPVDDAVAPSTARMLLLPGDFKLAMMNIREMSTLRLPRRRLEHFVQRARSEFACVVLDCNPSSSFITRCAVEMATHILVPVRPDRFSLLGVEMLFRYIKHLLGPHVPDVRMVLNDITDDVTVARAVADLRGHGTYGPLVLANSIRRSDVLKSRTDYTGFATDRRPPNWVRVQSVLADVASEYATVLGV